MAEQQNIEAYEAGIKAETEALFRASRPNASECARPNMAYWRTKVLENRIAVTAAGSRRKYASTQVTPFDTLAELRDALHDLNYERGIATAAVVINDVVHLAYCTDPDGEWFLENDDPEERIVEDETGWRQYERLGLDSFTHGPYTIIWPAAPDTV